MGNEDARAVPFAADSVLEIERVYDAPLDRVWAALTNRDHAVHWWHPERTTVIELEMDVRPGGAWRKRMRNDNGEEFSNGGVYRVVDKPNRIVFTYAVADRETLVAFTLTEQGGKTRLTLAQTDFPTVAYRDSHRTGWTGALRNLDALVAGLR